RFTRVHPSRLSLVWFTRMVQVLLKLRPSALAGHVTVALARVRNWPGHLPRPYRLLYGHLTGAASCRESTKPPTPRRTVVRSWCYSSFFALTRPSQTPVPQSPYRGSQTSSIERDAAPRDSSPASVPCGAVPRAPRDRRTDTRSGCG